MFKIEWQRKVHALIPSKSLDKGKLEAAPAAVATHTHCPPFEKHLNTNQLSYIRTHTIQFYIGKVFAVTKHCSLI